MNFNKLRYVAAVDRAASITAAAQVLNISQSAVTKAVADIEAKLGFTIFERRSHGVTTTAAGRDFINRAARILSDIDHLADDMRDNRRTTEMLLRVAITPASLEALMNRATVALLGAHPQMRLHMRGVSLERGAQLLRQGDAEAVIGPRKAFDTEANLNFTELPDMNVRLYARKGHPLAGRPQLSAADIAQFPIIAPDIQGPLVTPLLDVLGLLGGNPMRRLHIIETYPIAARLVAESEAIGVVLKNFTQTQGFTARFETLDFSMGPPIPFVVASRRENRENQALARFCRAVRNHPPIG